MAILRRDTGDDEGGLDSLLDTMTNVVGILVLVLIVTQLGVSEKVAEITANSNITEEDVASARQELEARKSEKAKLEVQATQLASIDIEAERERLKRLEEMLATQKKLLADQNKQANEFSAKIASDKEMAAKKTKEIEDNKQKREQLQQQLTAALERKTELEAKLDKTPRRSAPAAAKTVSIPNPRPAPSGAKQATFICSGNRLYPVNLETIRKDAEARAKEIIIRHRLLTDPKQGIDPKKFAEYYTKLKYPTDMFFDVEYYVAGNRWPRLKFIPKEDKGGSEEEIRRPNSRIRRLLDPLNPKDYYCRFYVLPDSFDIYLTARHFVSDKGLLAGWEPQDENWVYTTSIPGGIELGPPQPKPEPTNTPPAKPANVID